MHFFALYMQIVNDAYMFYIQETETDTKLSKMIKTFDKRNEQNRN